MITQVMIKIPQGERQSRPGAFRYDNGLCLVSLVFIRIPLSLVSYVINDILSGNKL